MFRIDIFFKIVLSALVAFHFSLNVQSSDRTTNNQPLYLNTSYSFEERAADLVSRLTPEEKEIGRAHV